MISDTDIHLHINGPAKGLVTPSSGSFSALPVLLAETRINGILARPSTQIPLFAGRNTTHNTIMSIIYNAITAPITTALSLSNSAVGLASDAVLSVGSVVASSKYSPLVGVVERSVVGILEEQVKYGRLTLVLPDGRVWTSGAGEDARSEVVKGEGHGRKEKAERSENTPRRNTPAVSTFDVDSSSDDDRSSSRLASSFASTATLVGSSSTPVASSFKLAEMTGSGDAASSASVPFTGVNITADLKPTETGEGPHVIVRIHWSTFFLRILLSGDLGFAESYMAGECSIETTRNPSQLLSPTYYSSSILDPSSPLLEGSSLIDLFQLIIRSDHPGAISAPGRTAQKKRDALNAGGISAGLQSLPAAVFSVLGRWTTNSRIVNSVRNSVGNIRAHYDISNR